MKHCIYYDKSTRLRFVIIKAGVFLLWAVASTLCLAGPASSAATAARASGDRVDAVMQQVRVHVDEGDFEQALALLAPYQERPGIYPTLTSDYLVIMAWSGRPAEAVRQFESLPDSFPRRSYLLRNMAKAYFDLARYARAASLYAEVVAADPQDHTATEGLVEALVARGDLNAARQALARLKDGSGDRLRADLFEARLLFYRGHYEQSFLLYDRLIDAPIILPKRAMTGSPGFLPIGRPSCCTASRREPGSRTHRRKWLNIMRSVLFWRVNIERRSVCWMLWWMPRWMAWWKPMA